MPPHHHSASYINTLSRDRYGTDVPTLWGEIARLDRKIQHQHDVLLRKERERHDLKRRYEKLQAGYRLVWEAYERTVGALREEKRRWRGAALLAGERAMTDFRTLLNELHADQDERMPKDASGDAMPVLDRAQADGMVQASGVQSEKETGDAGLEKVAMLDPTTSLRDFFRAREEAARAGTTSQAPHAVGFENLATTDPLKPARD
ncbi:hypothetical protein B0A55_00916 [Friedmanniomyces simplex]|uniref:Uncharacterized protein n=1 Tax=Friedmanniomyces simplex TaxID=329884 RepID=A0A4U0XYK7_9PEZI|nr:hypothetical protein B0A55_00916 [Friedmanniomyces simplex]